MASGHWCTFCGNRRYNNRNIYNLQTTPTRNMNILIKTTLCSPDRSRVYGRGTGLRGRVDVWERSDTEENRGPTPRREWHLTNFHCH